MELHYINTIILQLYLAWAVLLQIQTWKKDLHD